MNLKLSAKNVVIALVVLFVVAFLAFNYGFSGFFDGGNQGDDQLNLYAGIPSAEIPGECLAHRSDVCALYECMVDLCWCKEGSDQILFDGGADFLVEDEESAKRVVAHYLQSVGSDYEVKRAVELDNVFHNVFAENAGGDEKVFTVAADGKIIQTVCGV